MNNYSFEEVKVGMKESFKVNITDSMLHTFGGITGDINPLHNDSKFAKQHGFNERVVYGMLTASFLSTLAGVYIPGEKSLIHSVEIKFVRPVFVGDELLIEGTIEEMNDSVRQIVIKVVITNQFNNKVSRGRMKVGFLND